MPEARPENLAKYAVSGAVSRGRKHAEPAASQARTPFQKDRDRIIHARAFRRLKDKTQVFIPHHDDHARNRPTHTLEVAQIARDIARMLGLNEDLAEAIALAHDLGHTPFGHAGEEALDECLKEHSKMANGTGTNETGANRFAIGLLFEHNEQSQRVVEELEHVYPGFPGLNLSVEVLEGLMKHQTFWDKPEGDDDGVRPSLEAQVVNLADEIAYQNHDVDDGLRSGLFTEDDLAEVELWKMASELARGKYGEIEDGRIRIARTVSKMIGLMIHDAYEETLRRLRENAIEDLDDVYACENVLVGFSDEVAKANAQLREFLTKRVYFTERVQEYSKRGQSVIKKLFAHYIADGMDAAEARDFIAGMTDHFALQKAEELDLEL